MRVSNPSVILNRGGKQDYIVRPAGGRAPPEGDWFTRLLERGFSLGRVPYPRFWTVGRTVTRPFDR